MPVVICLTMLLAACGKEEKADTASLVETLATDATTDQESVVQEQAVDSINEVISEEQAYDAVINYCEATNPDFDLEVNSEGYTEYWDVSTNENGEIVVLYRSYTGAQTRYYVDPSSGETYVTELVPGIIDEEQKTGETFNVRNYLGETNLQTSSGDASKADVVVLNDGSDTFYDALDAFYGEYSYKNSSDGLDGTLSIIQELNNSREYSIYDNNPNGYRFIAMGSNIEYIKDNRFYLKYPEMVYADDTAVFKYYIVEKNGKTVSLYEADENYENPALIYTANAQ
jgi:hypothetical protein